jgi:hypothetical protein
LAVGGWEISPDTFGLETLIVLRRHALGILELTTAGDAIASFE